MDIIPSNLTSSGPSLDQISSRSESLDRADFLKMLTAQLRAQDPLNPLSGQDFATQLATFSSVQELQSINSALYQSMQTDALMAQSFGNSIAATLIGKVVRAETNEAIVGSSGSVALNYSLPEAATSVKVEIRDSAGTLVRTVECSAQEAGDHRVEWDGLNSEGQRVAAGTYTYTIKAENAQGEDLTATTFYEGRVSEVSFEQDGTVLLHIGDMTFQLGQVLSIRDSEDEKGNYQRC